MNEDFEGLNLVELINLLEPVPEPPVISLMPQTIGWVWVGLLAGGAIVWGIAWTVRRYRANAYRRAALAELVRAGEDPAQIAAILRRAAISAFPRADVAGLTGAAWLEFLDRSFSGTGFRTGPGAILPEAPYAPQVPATPGLNALARDWIRRHGARGRT